MSYAVGGQNEHDPVNANDKRHIFELITEAITIIIIAENFSGLHAKQFNSKTGSKQKNSVSNKLWVVYGIINHKYRTGEQQIEWCERYEPIGIASNTNNAYHINDQQKYFKMYWFNLTQAIVHPGR